MKKILLFCWYLIGVIISFPAIIFIIISRWFGIQAENRAFREMTKEDLKIDDNNEEKK